MAIPLKHSSLRFFASTASAASCANCINSSGVASTLSLQGSISSVPIFMLIFAKIVFIELTRSFTTGVAPAVASVPAFTLLQADFSCALIFLIVAFAIRYCFPGDATNLAIQVETFVTIPVHPTTWVSILEFTTSDTLNL